MATATYRNLRFTLLGAATSMAADSTIRRLSATCGLVLLPQAFSRASCLTIVAMSTQPATLTVRTDIQSAVSPNFSYHNPKEKSEFT